MKLINLIQKHRYFIGIHTLVFLVAYRTWTLNLGILTRGDWNYYFNESLKTLRINYFSLWLSDNSFGRALIDIGQAPTYAVYGLFAKFLNFDYATSERLVHMFPIIIVAPIGAYLLLLKQFKNTSAAIVGSIVYSYNTYTLTLETGHLTLAGAFAFVPITFYFFDLAIHHKKKTNVVLAALSLAIITAYEPRAAYIFILLLFAYAIYAFAVNGVTKHTDRRRILLSSVCVFVIYLSLNFYWIYALTLVDGGAVGILSRGLFGSTFYNLSEALTLFHPFWTGAEPAVFDVQKIPLYFWVIPSVAMSGLFLNRRNKFILFFGCITLIGLLLTKQSALPLPNLYLWLYNNIPGFNAFREASKFYSLIVFGYTILIAAFIESLMRIKKFERYHINIAISTTLALIFLFNLKPLVTGNINTLFVVRHVPPAYLSLKKYLLDDNSFSRSFWVPISSRWGIVTAVHPRIDSAGVAGGVWAPFVPGTDRNTPLQYSPVAIFSRSFAETLFKAGSIKNVIVPIRDKANDDDFFIDYGDDREFFIKTLSQVPWLKRVVLQSNDLAIFQATEVRPYISAISELLNLNKIENLDEQYAAANSISSKNNLDFNITDNSTIPGVTNFTDIFNFPNNYKINRDKISATLTTPAPGSVSNLYSSDTVGDISYITNEKYVTFNQSTKDAFKVVNDNLSIQQSSSTTELYKMELAGSSSYLIGMQDKLLPIINDSKSHILKDSNAGLAIYNQTDANLVKNAGFNDGFWQAKVEDCNQYDANSNLSMSIIGTSETNSSKALKLGAAKHIACSHSSRMTLAAGNYIVSFKYQARGTRQAGYRLINEINNSSVSEKVIDVDDNSWHTFRGLVHLESDFDKVNLELRAFPDDKRKVSASVSFGDIEVQKLDSVHVITAQGVIAKPELIANNVSIKTADYFGQNDYKNLINNPTLTNRLWRNKVGDCNAYDNNPKIAMKSFPLKNGNENGLQLEASSHIACTGPPTIAVQDGGNYELNFKYQSPNSSQIGYSLTFDDMDHTQINKRIDLLDKEWHDFAAIINVPYGAKNVSLTFYSFSVEGEPDNIISRYSNFKFGQVPDLIGRYSVSSKNAGGLVQPRTISYNEKLSSSTKKYVEIHGASDGFILTMAENFSPQWQIETAGQNESNFNSFKFWEKSSVLTGAKHIKLDYFLNGWYINLSEICKISSNCTRNADGTYNLNLKLEYAAQHKFRTGLLFSIITFFACIIYLLYYQVVKKT